jgi:hypothetical protein
MLPLVYFETLATERIRLLAFTKVNICKRRTLITRKREGLFNAKVVLVLT